MKPLLATSAAVALLAASAPALAASGEAPTSEKSLKKK